MHVRELAGRQKLYVLKWECNGARFGNHYISGYPPYDADRMLRWADVIAGLDEPFDWEV